MQRGEWKFSGSRLGDRAWKFTAGVGLGVFFGEAVSFWLAFFTPAGCWVLKFPSECAWTLLAFPFGWLGYVAGALSPTIGLPGLSYRYICLSAGIVLNALFWAWVAYRFMKLRCAQAGYTGFDASIISSHLHELRQNHVAAAHARCYRPAYARKAMVGAARNALSRCGYFFSRAPTSPEAPREPLKNTTAPKPDPAPPN